MKKIKNNYKFILLLLIFTLFSTTALSLVKKEPVAVKGILDLREWDFTKDGILNIKGEYELYFNQVYSPEDFQNDLPDNATRKYIDYHKRDNIKGLEEKDFKKDKALTIRLKILLKKSHTKSAIRFMNNGLY